MLYLLLAVFSSVGVSLIMRLSAKKAPGSLTMLAANYLMCLCIAAGFTGADALFPKDAALPGTLAMGTVNGVIYLVSFILYQRSVRRNGMVLSSTFMKLGLLVPIAVSVLVFHKLPNLFQAVGFLLAVAAIVVMHIPAGKDAGRFSPGLLLLLLTGGGANAMSEIYEQVGAPALSSQFLFYTFLAAFLICLLLAIWKKERPSRYSLLYGLAIGIPNYFSARFLLLSLKTVPSFIAHPTYSTLSVCLVCLLGVWLFQERLTRRQWVSTGIILAALILLNL